MCPNIIGVIGVSVEAQDGDAMTIFLEYFVDPVVLEAVPSGIDNDEVAACDGYENVTVPIGSILRMVPMEWLVTAGGEVFFVPRVLIFATWCEVVIAGGDAIGEAHFVDDLVCEVGGFPFEGAVRIGAIACDVAGVVKIGDFVIQVLIAGVFHDALVDAIGLAVGVVGIEGVVGISLCVAGNEDAVGAVVCELWGDEDAHFVNGIIGCHNIFVKRYIVCAIVGGAVEERPALGGVVVDVNGKSFAIEGMACVMDGDVGVMIVDGKFDHVIGQLIDGNRRSVSVGGVQGCLTGIVGLCGAEIVDLVGEERGGVGDEAFVAGSERYHREEEVEG